MKSNFFLCLLIAACAGCTNPSEQEGVYTPEGLDRREKTRFQQYLIQGRLLYVTHCSNCHQLNGQGLAKLYPPLAKSDYFIADIQRAACIVKNGQKGEIIVNDVIFNTIMPPPENISNLEIAEILTYIGNNWGNQKGFITVKNVDTYLRECAN